MNLLTIKNDFNRGRMNIEDIKELINTVKELEEENGLMAEKHAEKDMAIQVLMQMVAEKQERIAQLENVKEMYLNANLAMLNQNDQLISQIKEMKQNSRLTRFYDMAEENLRMAQEVEIYKAMVQVEIKG